VPRVTRLRRAARGRVAVELDGRPWRELPADVVVSAGLVEGLPLERERLRGLGRELRRQRALDAAARALAARDASAAEVDERLRRRGVPPAARGEALAVLERGGLVDDARFAARRAALLAERGAGDAMIRDDLERRGLAGEHVEAALAALEPERERARRLVADGRSARWLASRGFDGDALESLVADEAGRALGY
jgi:SOS response regulatory protein OraA/RecX